MDGVGEQFSDVRSAMDYIKVRSAAEHKTVRDYTINPEAQEEEML